MVRLIVFDQIEAFAQCGRHHQPERAIKLTLGAICGPTYELETAERYPAANHGKIDRNQSWLTEVSEVIQQSIKIRPERQLASVRVCETVDCILRQACCDDAYVNVVQIHGAGPTDN
jgi:hypothetical protein